MVLITAGWIISGYLSLAQSLYPEFVAGLLGALMLYLTGNVGSKFVVGRYLVEKAKQKGVDSNGSHD